MNDASDREETVRVKLVGGPEELPSEFQVRGESLTHYSIKLEHLGGYEHFAKSDEESSDPRFAAVFRWTMRTRIAE